MERVLKKSIYGRVQLAVKVVALGAGVFAPAVPAQYVAIKIYHRTKLREYLGRTQENPFEEVAALQYIGNDHPNVMGQIGCCWDATNLYSVMDFVDGSEMFDVVAQAPNGRLSEDAAKHIFIQMVRGTQRIHGMGLWHRDMSLENVMCSKQYNVRIIDFGMSSLLPRRPDGTVIPIGPQVACGKRHYWAPEVVVSQEPFNPQHADLWALGIMLFIMLTGVMPMKVASDLDEGYREVRSGRLGDMLQHWGVSLSPAAVDLLTRDLQADPAQRLSLEGMLAHPWLRSAVEEGKAAS